MSMLGQTLGNIALNTLGGYGGSGVGRIEQGPDNQKYVTVRNAQGHMMSKPMGTLTTEDYNQLLQPERGVPQFGGGQSTLGTVLSKVATNALSGGAAGGASGLLAGL
jgi:hypothetical protein